MILAVVATIGVGVIWLSIMPRGTRGLGWHLAHAPVPAAVIILVAVLPPGHLREALLLWTEVGLAGLAVLASAWLLGTFTRNHGMMDVVYSVTPAVMAWSAAALRWNTLTLTAWTVLTLVTLWSTRTVVHGLRENYHRIERQPYATWRIRYGDRWLWWSFFQVYLLQGVGIWIYIAPFVFAVMAPANRLASAAGALLWLIGFGMEAFSDHQLARFRSDPTNKGRILDTGLWAFVRQPNYLGESLLWWGYFVCALAHPWGAVSFVGPLYVTWCMGYSSAGPKKELHMARTRGVAWQAYCARTPRFFPWPRPQHR
jgi:steroid 5-alpha reductase family enzyme